MKQRDEFRQFILAAWQKYQSRQLLSQLESQIIEIMQDHPEYHTIFAEADLEKDFRTDNNPYLHISLHLSLRDQLATNRPTGIIGIYQQLLNQWQDKHLVEHRMMDVMAQLLWDAQQKSEPPKDEDYLSALQKLFT
jgi:hypothetical protein